MALTKNRKKALELVDVDTTYSLRDAAGLLKQMPTMKFDASIDVAVRDRKSKNSHDLQWKTG